MAVMILAGAAVTVMDVTATGLAVTFMAVAVALPYEPLRFLAVSVLAAPVVPVAIVTASVFAVVVLAATRL